MAKVKKMNGYEKTYDKKDAAQRVEDTLQEVRARLSDSKTFLVLVYTGKGEKGAVTLMTSETLTPDYLAHALAKFMVISREYVQRGLASDEPCTCPECQGKTPDNAIIH